MEYVYVSPKPFIVRVLRADAPEVGGPWRKDREDGKEQLVDYLCCASTFVVIAHSGKFKFPCFLGSSLQKLSCQQ